MTPCPSQVHPLGGPGPADTQNRHRPLPARLRARPAQLDLPPQDELAALARLFWSGGKLVVHLGNGNTGTFEANMEPRFAGSFHAWELQGKTRSNDGSPKTGNQSLPIFRRSQHAGDEAVSGSREALNVGVSTRVLARVFLAHLFQACTRTLQRSCPTRVETASSGLSKFPPFFLPTRGS